MNLSSIVSTCLVPFLLLLTANTAAACMVYVPLEVRIVQSSHIVEGEITAVETKEPWQYGTLKVGKVFKGDKDTRELTVVWRAPRKGPGIIADGPMRYKQGQKGIWILTAKKDIGLMASYPGDLSTDDKATKRITDALAKVKALRWQKEGDLEWTVLTEVHALKPPQERNGVVNYARGQFFPLVRNPGDKPRHVLDYLPHRTIRGSVTAPDGKQIAVKGGRVNMDAVPHPGAFRLVAPGKTISLGYGQQLPNFQQRGTYQLSMVYENAKFGVAAGKENVFKGKVEVKVEIVVPGEDG